MTDHATPETPDTPPESPQPAPVPKAANGHSKSKRAAKAAKKKPAAERNYPRATLERALACVYAIKKHNNGNPWAPGEVAKAVDRTHASTTFFYEAAAAIRFGLVEGGRDANEMSLTEFGRSLAYAPDEATEVKMRKQAFLKIDLFRGVLEYYGKTELPEMTYLGNVLKDKFDLDPELHTEFVDLFQKNCAYLGIKTVADLNGSAKTNGKAVVSVKAQTKASEDVVTIAEPEDGNGEALRCFVIMPFGEKGHTPRPHGFFTEVLNQLIVPAAKAAGFRVQTARKKGTEVIQVTIVNNVLDADIVVADMTDHNPSVFLELGMRLRHDQPVAIIKAAGTPPVFDVDNMLRVEEYNPNLWASSIAHDVPKLTEHIRATWEGRDSNESFLKILRRGALAQEKQAMVN